MVKRLFTLSIALFMSAVFCFAETYELKIGSTQVTSENASDILGDGSAKYNPTTKTLSLNNCTTTSINSKIDGITIDCRVLKINTTGTGNAIYLNGNTTITGIGISINHGNSSSAIYMVGEGKTLTLNNASIGITCTAESTSTHAIRGFYGSEKFIMKNSKIFLSVKDVSTALEGFASADFGEAKVVYPANATYNTTAKTIINENSKAVKGKCIIDIPYGFILEGTEASYYTAGDSKATGIFKSGKAIVDISSKTLTLKNYDGNSELVNYNLPGMKVILVGENKINNAILEKDTEISGTGSLDITNTDKKDIALNIRGAKLNFADAKININGVISDDINTNVSEVNINNAEIIVKGNGTKGTIEHLKAFTTAGTEITLPVNAKFAASINGVGTGGTPTKTTTSEVQIATFYNVTVGVTKVSSINYNDVKGNKLVSYDALTHTLTLKNGFSGSAINDNNTDKTMNLDIYGSVATLNVIALGNLKIEGKTSDATMKVTNSSNDAGITGRNSSNNITIKNCAIDAATITGLGTLCLDNANVTLNGDNTKATIQGFDELNLINGTKIVDPYFITYDKTAKKTVTSKGNYLSKIVLAKAYDVAVGNALVTEENRKDVLGDGTVSYDDISKTITLNNATIETDSNPAISFLNDENVIGKIVVKGTNSISSNSSSAIFSNCNLDIIGDGDNASLTATEHTTASSTDAPIRVDGKTLNIKNVEITTYGYEKGIAGSVEIENINLQNAKFTAHKALNKYIYAINAFKNITLDNAQIYSDFAGITTSRSDANVIAKGNSTIETTSGVCIATSNPLNEAGSIHITGVDNPTLNLNSKSSGYAAIHLNHDLSISNLKLNVKGSTAAIACNKKNLTLDGTELHAKISVSNNSAFTKIGSINIDSYYDITTPNTVFNQEKSTFTVDGVSAMAVDIEPMVSVNGIGVNGSNAYNLADGHVTYDINTKELTLDNANIAANDQPAIKFAYNNDETVSIKVIGTNIVSSETNNGIYANCSLNIVGEGKDADLTVSENTATDSNVAPVTVNGANISVKNVSLTTKGLNKSFAGNNTFENITFENATYTTKKSHTAFVTAIKSFKNLTLNNAKISGTDHLFSNENIAPKVNVKGINTVYASGICFLFKNVNLTNETISFSGDDIAVLNVNAGGPGYAAFNCGYNLDFSNMKLFVKGNTAAFSSNTGNYGVKLNNVQFYVSALTAMQNIASLSYDKYYTITTPDTYLNEEKHTFYTNDKAAKEIRIEPALYVAGEGVTELNATYLANGHASFNIDMMELALNNADINTIEEGIKNNFNGLKVITYNNSSITSSDKDAIFSQGNISFEGDGTLTLKSLNADGIKHNGEINIKNANLDVTGKEYAIHADGESIVFNIDNSAIHATANTAAVYGYTDNTINASENCYISAPEKAAFDNDAKGIAVNGALCKEVTIALGQPIIDGIKTNCMDNDNNDAPVYNLQGVKVSKSYHGIVIRNGVKYRQ